MSSPETVTEPSEVVPDVGACYTIDEKPEDMGAHSGFDVFSDDDIERVSANDSDNDFSGYEGDCDIGQGDVSENGDDSDLEARIALANKSRLLLQKKASGKVDSSISDMPLENLFEPVEEVINDEDDDLNSEYLGSSYTDETVSDYLDEGLMSAGYDFDEEDSPTDKENLAPNELFGAKVPKICKSVKRKLSSEDES